MHDFSKCCAIAAALLLWAGVAFASGAVTADDASLAYEEAPSVCGGDDPEATLFARLFGGADKGDDAHDHPQGPAISIVIDDIGPDEKRSRRALDVLPREVTFAILPYARKAGDFASQAGKNGHEVIVHMPMKPSSAMVDPGPDHLIPGLDEAELRRRIGVQLGAFTGYDGVNNHMGSAFTRDRAGMDVLMSELKTRGLFFLDSMTAPDSKGQAAAMAAGVKVVQRDVFLDHVPDLAHVRRQLAQAERVARRKGFAVAIGHPKDATLDALEAWIPDAQARGFRLVRVSSAIAK